MKRENERVTNWLTILIELISMIAAFYLSAYIRGGIIQSGYFNNLYSNALIVLIFSCILIHNIDSNKNNIFKRGYFEELIHIFKNQGKLGLILLAYMFMVQQGSSYSRVFLTIFFVLNVLVNYVLLSYLKIFMLVYYKKSTGSRKVMLITTSRNASKIIRRIRRENEWQIYVTMIALWDENRIGERIEGIEVVADQENLFEVVKRNVVDEVFINIPRSIKIDLEALVLEFEKMGIIVHLNLDIFGNIKLKEKRINELAGHNVVTFSTKLFDEKHAFLKRAIDILGAFAGCIVLAILTLFLAPAIILESEGPVFFKQTRVGKNGRKFKIYKFRSMYKDAEQRKKDLMAQNEMNGLMFKMTDDPRITKVGKFIRKTSLDEFPQFVNVLFGDMSLVGTRPPTEDEFLQYEGVHKRRLMLKPGLTGLWQVSGRSDITDFEEVVRMDLEYIDNWSIKLDVKLIAKTVGIVVFGRGAR
ncbi:MAG: Undecaprenyl-phosphate galactosephosphotransferase [Firmicutes bacterium]|nr:Undecaprenyl-phosphate galactosephosphotransferase [Bacillota bacterium]